MRRSLPREVFHPLPTASMGRGEGGEVQEPDAAIEGGRLLSSTSKPPSEKILLEGPAPATPPLSSSQLLVRPDEGLHPLRGWWVQSALWGAAQVWSRALGFLQSLLLARWLGPEDFGRFTVLQSWLILTHQSGSSGLSSLMVRDLARADRPRVRLYLLIQIGWVLLILAIAVILSFTDYVPPSIRGDLPFLTALLLPMAWLTWQGTRLTAAGRLERAAGMLFFTRTVGLTVMTLAARYGWTALWLGFAGMIVLDGIGLRWMADRFSAPLSGRSGGEPMRAPGALREGLRMLGFGIVGALYARADSLMLLTWRGPVEAGFYGLAYRFYEAGLLLSNALFTAILPRLAMEAHPERRAHRLLKILLGLAALSALGLTFLADPLIRLPFGSAYQPAIPMLRGLVWAWPPAFLSSLGSAIWIARGRSDRLFRAFLFGTALNLALNALLIPRWGGMGAALAMLGSSWGMGILFLPAFHDASRPQDPGKG
ncbi:oligosaccharide flippase family protein [Thermoflexus sp.]|uniref:lipopolysaccharide biosynthesis protein n=1 Tax=Thermoflexus sp. TaxID=1969742 RepID=UPI0025D313E0|nr:oligosaccharide flippase family protein [Thermoflexus sp.]MDW8179534.1 polysaccharide biosynthesis C-terminal domain-containing protein [Anaerolineae bacterium]MCS6962790.1 polysaccharide biosynthesis C-terminal domain-containing protein [Thermoflexus sp.]MCS7350085.1 polysaccharide biosynthesis C-terminal domain-containing protein [Thermoflexus sp.]MCX7689449.1 polysaccharide biosynthesis C-terminal domain-containing protein [Thermoflexus sp.]MDW8184734.1 polysaccharide biosynthesis C-term